MRTSSSGTGLMALRIKCGCGKQLTVSSKLADKRIACPACNRPFRIPLSRFESASPGKKRPSSKTNPASAVRSQDAFPAAALAGTPTPAARPLSSAAAPPPPIPTEQPAPSEIDPTPASLDDELSQLEISGVPVQSSTDVLTLRGEAPTDLETGSQPAAGVGYARDRLTRTIPGRTSKVTEVVQGPTRGFWSDAFYCFVYPFGSAGNGITFAIVAVVSLISIPLGYAGCLGAIGQLIIFGWLCSLYLSVVQETAVGSNDLPGIKMEEGFIDDIIKPALKFIGAFAVALFPAVIYTIALATGGLPGFMQSGLALFVWMGLGFFLWPVFVMLFAFNALNMIYRIDLIFTTVFRTFGAYLCMWIMLLLVGFLYLLPILGFVFAALGLNLSAPKLPGGGLEIDVVMNVLNVYFSIVAMRLIGLYYLHYKRKFTLLFE